MKIILLAALISSFTVNCYADMLKLKNGRELEGKIVEETADHIKINLGVGIVGFNKSQVEEIQKSDQAEMKDLENRLEKIREEASEISQQNDKLYQTQESHTDLIQQSNVSNQQDDLRARREEILRKRREQLEQLRKQREQAINSRVNNMAANNTTAPLPPIPNPEGMNAQLPQIPQVPPEQLSGNAGNTGNNDSMSNRLGKDQTNSRFKRNKSIFDKDDNTNLQQQQNNQQGLSQSTVTKEESSRKLRIHRLGKSKGRGFGDDNEEK